MMMTQVKACARALLIVVMLSAMALWSPGETAEDKGYALGDMTLGAADAPVTTIEYASMTCPHCAAFHGTTYKALKTKYIDTGKVKFIFREFPLDGLALRASMLARCAGKERFFPMVDVLFAQQMNWSRAPDPIAALAKIGRLGGVGPARFEACMKDQSLYDVVLNNRLAGEKKHEISSTPSFVINGDKVSGNRTIEDFDRILAKLLP